MLPDSKEVNSLFKRDICIVFIITMLATISYLPLISKGLTNPYDGLWWSSYSLASDWQISCGRWGWFILDRLRGGYAGEPFNSLLTLLFMTVSSVIIFSLWERRTYHIVHSLLVVVCTTTCSYLSYRFQSPTFGASFFLSVAAAYVLVRELPFTDDHIKKLVTSAILLCLSLSLYQTNVGTFSAIVVINMLFLLLNNKKSAVLRQLCDAFIVGISGCLIYLLIWKLFMKAKDITASGYNGTDSISISTILQGLPIGILNTYREFLKYFASSDGYYLFRFLRVALFILVFALVLIKGIVTLKHDISSLLLYIVLFLLLPLTSSIYFLMTPGTNLAMIQMTGSFTIVVPLLLCLLDFNETNIKRFFFTTIGILLLYGNIYAVGTDVDAMSQGTDSTYSIMKDVQSSLISSGLYGPQYTYVYIGKMSENPLFRKNELWDRANLYAQFGNFWGGSDCLYQTYDGLMKRFGLNLPIGSPEQYEEILSDPSTETLPVYPEEGSIIARNDLVIIKISNKYRVDE